MKVLRVLLISLLVCWPLMAQSQPNLKSPHTLLLEHVTVIDSTGSDPRADTSVLIEGDKIKSIFSSRQSKPAGVGLIVDGSGKFLIAGLWDMHVHALSQNNPERFFPLFIANGVTGIRDMGGDIPLSQVAQLKKDIHDGFRLGPEIFAAGPILEGEHPFWPFSISVKNPTEARQTVAKLVKEGADFLKVYNTLSRDAYLAIASQAKESGIPFEGHIPDGVTPAEASSLGQKSIEHLWGIPAYLSSESVRLQSMGARANDEEDPKVARDLYYRINETILATSDVQRSRTLYEEFARNHTWQTPTLVVLKSYATIHDPILHKDPRTAYIPDNLIGFWNSMGGQPDPRNDEIQLRLFEYDIAIVKAMYKAKVPLLAGTDTPNPYTYPGFSLHEELELLVSAGFTPMGALQTATLRAAQFLGVSQLLGTVEEGKMANLVLLDANPLEDISNTKTIRGVILRGQFLDKSRLDELLAGQRIARTQK
jgi:Amidohydrolase family